MDFVPGVDLFKRLKRLNNGWQCGDPDIVDNLGASRTCGTLHPIKFHKIESILGGDFDIVLGWDPAAGTDGEFDFAIRKGMSFGFIEVGGFGDEDVAGTPEDEGAMSVAFGRSFTALMDGLNFEPTLTWDDGDMSMSMGVTISF